MCAYTCVWADRRRSSWTDLQWHYCQQTIIVAFFHFYAVLITTINCRMQTIFDTMHAIGERSCFGQFYFCKLFRVCVCVNANLIQSVCLKTRFWKARTEENCSISKSFLLISFQTVTMNDYREQESLNLWSFVRKLYTTSHWNCVKIAA